MAQPTCPFCEAKTFQLTTIHPEGSKFGMCLIHCSECGAPAGLTEAQNVPQLVQELRQTIVSVAEAAMAKVLDRIEDLEKKLSGH